VDGRRAFVLDSVGGEGGCDTRSGVQLLTLGRLRWQPVASKLVAVNGVESPWDLAVNAMRPLQIIEDLRSLKEPNASCGR
jgi:hypothetical protein